ncbi:MAG: DUF2148 domain-containing protein [Methanomicrobiaceae archaeon]|nr:DUF2148 domain-containing protein [Methanomicrobiaceae archaeon]
MNRESDAVAMVAHLMALSARTAPKARGQDCLTVSVITGADLVALADEMRSIGEREGIGYFVRDASGVSESTACLLIGLQSMGTSALDCGGCGYPTCAEMLAAQQDSPTGGMLFSGPNCAVRVTDLGIAVGSAAKTASIHNVDNRIMYTAGVAARSLGWLQGCGVAYGIPLKASGKNIFFDRTS